MNFPVSAVFRSPWLTKKRKAILTIFAVFAVSSTVYRGVESRTGAYEAHTRSGVYLRAGAYLCSSAYDAYNRRLLNLDRPATPCAQIGADMPVRILDRKQINQIEVVKVGNTGGVMWASSDDAVE